MLVPRYTYILYVIHIHTTCTSICNTHKHLYLIHTFIYHLYYSYMYIFILLSITLHTYTYTYVFYLLPAIMCVFPHRRDAHTAADQHNPNSHTTTSHTISFKLRVRLVTCIETQDSLHLSHTNYTILYTILILLTIHNAHYKQEMYKYINHIYILTHILIYTYSYIHTHIYL